MATKAKNRNILNNISKPQATHHLFMCQDSGERSRALGPSSILKTSGLVLKFGTDGSKVTIYRDSSNNDRSQYPPGNGPVLLLQILPLREMFLSTDLLNRMTTRAKNIRTNERTHAPPPHTHSVFNSNKQPAHFYFSIH